MKESLITSLQETLATTHRYFDTESGVGKWEEVRFRTHKEFIENLMASHRDEQAARDKAHEGDLEERMNEVCCHHDLRTYWVVTHRQLKWNAEKKTDGKEITLTTESRSPGSKAFTVFCKMCLYIFS